MRKYVGFLRGINVGNIRIKMTDLKLAFEQLGFGQVKTYLQTGNVVFDSDKDLKDLQLVLEEKLSKTFDYEAFVLLYEFEVLKGIMAAYPFERDEEHHAYVIFIRHKTILEELKILSKEVGEEAERISFGNNVCYWKVVRGESTETLFSKIVAKAKYKNATTIRNINTLEKMVIG
jgi:uncharacterized protein (DUF1697 family)